MAARPVAERQVDVGVVPVEVRLLHDEVDVAARALDLRPVDRGAGALDDVEPVHAVEARGGRVAREGHLLAAHVELRQVAADVGDGRDAVLRRGVDAGRELPEVHRVLDHAVVLHRGVHLRDGARDVEDVAVVAHDVAHGADGRQHLLLDRDVGDGVFLERRHLVRGEGGGGRRGGRCRGRRGLCAEPECEASEYATRRGCSPNQLGDVQFHVECVSAVWGPLRPVVFVVLGFRWYGKGMAASPPWARTGGSRS